MDLGGPRLAGTTAATALESVLFAATAADVTGVVIGGRDVVSGGRHLLAGDVPGALAPRWPRCADPRAGRGPALRARVGAFAR